MGSLRILSWVFLWFTNSHSLLEFTWDSLGVFFGFCSGFLFWGSFARSTSQFTIKKKNVFFGLSAKLSQNTRILGEKQPVFSMFFFFGFHRFLVFSVFFLVPLGNLTYS